MNNISHVDINSNYAGISVGNAQEEGRHVTIDQAVEAGKRTFYDIFANTKSSSIFETNFIDNSQTLPYGCSGNDRANGIILKSCIFHIREGWMWFGTSRKAQIPSLFLFI